MLIRREFCEGNTMTPNHAQKALLRLTESAVCSEWFYVSYIGSHVNNAWRFPSQSSRTKG